MDGIDDFLKIYQPNLLAYLDGIAPKSPEEPGPLEFVEHVLNEWSRIFEGRTLGAPCSRERTFWFALYQLEELVENPVQDELDPFEGVLMQNLAQVRELLRDWRELPIGFYATRPGENPDAF
ncbi:MAG: hypothetical protein O2971_07520 [Proteobacteria bacterium]|nr:hypothetical protein [Pseudomonadota bacterium]